MKGQSYSTTPPPAVPQFDFHQAVSLLGRHPALLRLFGLVYELELTRPNGLKGTVAVSVLPSWRPKLGGPPLTINVKPVTMTNAGEWIPAQRTSDPAITSGFFRLSAADYDVVEMDLDGATLKAFNFVQGIQRANTEMVTADTPTHYGVPSLRSAGLAVAKTGRALSLYQNWQNNNGFNAAVEASPPGAVTLYFEDIAQGYRVDVWSKARGRWFQLCARTGAENPGLGGYGIGSPPTVVPVPSGDEGWVEPATTQSASSGGAPNPPVYLPEYLMRWSGWSLVGARPGKHLSDVPSDGLEPDVGEPGQQQPSAPDRLRGHPGHSADAPLRWYLPVPGAGGRHCRQQHPVHQDRWIHLGDTGGDLPPVRARALTGVGPDRAQDAG